MSKEIIISEIQIEFVNHCSRLIGFASFAIDESLYITGLPIYKPSKSEGYKLIFPPKGVRSEWHPLNKQAALAIEYPIIAEVKRLLKKQKTSLEPEDSIPNPL